MTSFYKNMHTPTNPGRNRPTEEDRNNDPRLRDEDGSQPGAKTISSSDTDDLNQDLTETASDNFREDKDSENADSDLDDTSAEK